MSIFLDAIQRFVEPQEVSNPRLVLIVGCCGLISNVAGIVLLHEHETPQPKPDAASNGAGQNNVGASMRDVEQSAADAGGSSQVQPPRKLRARRPTGLAQIYMHPTSFRSQIVAASRGQTENDTERAGDEGGAQSTDEGDSATEQSPLLDNKQAAATAAGKNAISLDLHYDHIHSSDRGDRKKNRNSQDLNMEGVLLHVLGDAVGNLGVIASALFIWLTKFDWRFYCDPLISLIITGIILYSAIPLCKAASRILLQAVPQGINIDEIKADITGLPGVASCHSLHVWQLSDSNLITTVHVSVDHKITGSDHDRYMQLAAEIRTCLAAYGIQTSTIQPEFFRDTRELRGPQECR